jgi:hypothetical protein
MFGFFVCGEKEVMEGNNGFVGPLDGIVEIRV